MALYMRNTQPSCDAASYTVKILVPEQKHTRVRKKQSDEKLISEETNVSICLLLNMSMSVNRTPIIMFPPKTEPFKKITV